MNPTYEPKLACAAAGMNFEEWRRRPVYVTHCKTFTVAQELCGIRLAPGQGLATPLHGDSAGLTSFRALRPYRSPEGNALRSAVALEIRSRRRNPGFNA